MIRIASNGENSPAFFVSQDDLFAAWNEGHEQHFARSLTWGSRFEPPIKIADKNGHSFSGYPSIGVAPIATRTLCGSIRGARCVIPTITTPFTSR
jgi:hypothetical protein